MFCLHLILWQSTGRRWACQICQKGLELLFAKYMSKSQEAGHRLCLVLTYQDNNSCSRCADPLFSYLFSQNHNLTWPKHFFTHLPVASTVCSLFFRKEEQDWSRCHTSLFASVQPRRLSAVLCVHSPCQPQPTRAQSHTFWQTATHTTVVFLLPTCFAAFIEEVSSPHIILHSLHNSR